MGFSSFAVIAAAALTLASCQSTSTPASSGDGTRRHVTDLEFGSKVTKAEIANRIEQAVSRCWVGKDPAFADLKAAPLAPYPDAREKALQISLKDPKNRERYAYINICPASRENDTGYLIQVVEKGSGVEVVSALRRSSTAIELGFSPC